MNRTGAIVAIALVAALAICPAGAEAQTSTPKTPRAASAEATAPSHAEHIPAPQDERVDPIPDRVHWGYQVVRIGQSYQLKNGETARDVTVVFRDAYIDGRVDR